MFPGAARLCLAVFYFSCRVLIWDPKLGPEKKSVPRFSLFFTCFFPGLPLQGRSHDVHLLWDGGGPAGVFWPRARLLQRERRLQEELQMCVWQTAGLLRLHGRWEPLRTAVHRLLSLLHAHRCCASAIHVCVCLERGRGKKSLKGTITQSCNDWKWWVCGERALFERSPASCAHLCCQARTEVEPQLTSYQGPVGVDRRNRWVGPESGRAVRQVTTEELLCEWQTENSNNSSFTKASVFFI